MPRLILAPIVCLSMLVTGNGAMATELVRVCDDLSPWPPFSYPPPSGGDEEVTEHTGAMVEFVDALFSEIGLDYTIELRPWKRCMEEVLRSSGPGEFEVVVNASYTPQRAAAYHVSKAVYETTPGAFYRLDRFPPGLEVNSAADLKAHRICGVLGYNYQGYGLSDEDIFTRAGSLKKTMHMMEKGRCDLVVSSIEVVYGTKLFGDRIISSKVRATRVPSESVSTFHILIARGSPRGQLLLEQLNGAIDQLRSDGTWDRIMAGYQALMEQDASTPGSSRRSVPLSE